MRINCAPSPSPVAGAEAAECAPPTRSGTRMTRKSLTLVRVGPVTTRSPSVSKAVIGVVIGEERLEIDALGLRRGRNCRAVMMAPALSSPPSMPSVSQAMAEMPPKPSSASVRPSRNSASRPPLPLPRTVTVVSPPEMMATGGTKGWP